MKKSGRRTYLDEDKEALVVSSAKIEGGHGLPLDCCGVSKQFQNVINAVKSQYGDYNIQEEESLRYCRKVIKRVNKN